MVTGRMAAAQAPLNARIRDRETISPARAGPQAARDGGAESRQVDDPGFAEAVGQRPENQGKEAERQHVGGDHQRRGTGADMEVSGHLDDEGRGHVIVAVALKGQQAQDQNHAA